jgi:hypothetical protein
MPPLTAPQNVGCRVGRITAGCIRAHGGMREADRTVAAESVGTLSLTESKRFLAAIGKPFAPNETLRRALKRGNELGI